MKLFAVYNEILCDFRTFLNEFLNYCRIFKFTFFLGRFSFGFFSFLITRQLQKLCQVFSFSLRRKRKAKNPEKAEREKVKQGKRAKTEWGKGPGRSLSVAAINASVLSVSLSFSPPLTVPFSVSLDCRWPCALINLANFSGGSLMATMPNGMAKIN